MTYVISDLHGYSIEKLKTLLEKAGFCEDDFLYILGDVTLKSLAKLNKESPETVADILDYLRDCPLYEAVTAGGKDYFLCHSGIDEFEKSKKISDYPADAFIWAWPRIDDDYFDDIITVFGHTPTMNYGEQYRNKIIKTKTWIDIDMGAADGKTEPVLLRLDDMKEFRN